MKTIDCTPSWTEITRLYFNLQHNVKAQKVVQKEIERLGEPVKKQFKTLNSKRKTKAEKDLARFRLFQIVEDYDRSNS